MSSTCCAACRDRECRSRARVRVCGSDGHAPGLRGAVGDGRQQLRRDPLSGDLYLFCNRQLHRAKVLHWDGTGLCLYAKRLEKGRFACLWRDDEQRELELSESELRLFLEGCRLVGRMALSPAHLTEKDLYIERAL